LPSPRLFPIMNPKGTSMEPTAGTSARPLFGQIAVERSFVTSDHVHQALKIQQDLVAQGRPHRLIGILLVELGMMSTTQLIDVLKEVHQRTRRMAVVAPREHGR